MKTFKTLTAAALALTVSAGALADEIWHIKAVHPDGYLLPVKALTADDRVIPVKAVQKGGNLHFLGVKALDGDETLPIKVLAKEGEVYSVKAIAMDGTIVRVKALDDGIELPVKGVSEDNGLIAIKAILPDGRHIGVKAVSQAGRVYDVKGLKMVDEATEGSANGVNFFAHVKAVPQT